MPKLTHDHDDALDRWAAGLTAKLTARAMGGISHKSVASIVEYARRRGDERAHRRHKLHKQAVEKIGRPR